MGAAPKKQDRNSFTAFFTSNTIIFTLVALKKKEKMKSWLLMLIY